VRNKVAVACPLNDKVSGQPDTNDQGLMKFEVVELLRHCTSSSALREHVSLV